MSSEYQQSSSGDEKLNTQLSPINNSDNPTERIERQPFETYEHSIEVMGAKGKIGTLTIKAEGKPRATGKRITLLKLYFTPFDRTRNENIKVAIDIGTVAGPVKMENDSPSSQIVNSIKRDLAFYEAMQGQVMQNNPLREYHQPFLFDPGDTYALEERDYVFPVVIGKGKISDKKIEYFMHGYPDETFYDFLTNLIDIQTLDRQEKYKLLLIGLRNAYHALDVLHSLGIAHGEPASVNVMINSNDLTTHLIDFAGSQLTNDPNRLAKDFSVFRAYLELNKKIVAELLQIDKSIVSSLSPERLQGMLEAAMATEKNTTNEQSKEQNLIEKYARERLRNKINTHLSAYTQPPINDEDLSILQRVINKDIYEEEIPTVKMP